jgi:pullulanase
MRKSHPAFQLTTATQVKKYLHFLDVGDACTVAFTLNGKAVGDDWARIVVVLNAECKAVDVRVPEGDYTIVCRDGRMNISNREHEVKNTFLVPLQTALIAWSPN